jgi:ribosomal RNA-processing protein 12
LTESLPTTSLGLIPEILSEAVLGTKEVNEKARDAGFDLLVVMGHKMAKGGVVKRVVAVENEEGEEIEGQATEGESLYCFLTLIFCKGCKAKNGT